MNPSISSFVRVYKPLIDVIPVEMGAYVSNVVNFFGWPINKSNEYKIKKLMFFLCIYFYDVKLKPYFFCILTYKDVNPKHIPPHKTYYPFSTIATNFMSTNESFMGDRIHEWSNLTNLT